MTTRLVTLITFPSITKPFTRLSYNITTPRYINSGVMRAVIIPKTGDIDVLQVSTVEKPIVSKGKLLVRNKFAGINFIDTYHRSGLYKVALPYIPGTEASGIVEAVGEDVTQFKVGDRVAYIAPNCQADYALAPERATAMSLAKLVYEVKRGDRVLIHAAAGGTGRLLVQLCKHLGAFVIGTTSNAEKAVTAKAAGADEVILYTEKDIVTEVMRITNGKGVHVVYDGVGKSTFDASLACLCRLGSMVSFGNASGKVVDIDIMKLVPRCVKVMRPQLFEFIKTKEEFDALVDPFMNLLKTGEANLLIHKIYDLSEIRQAQEDLTGRKTEGKLLLRL
ncbi:NADPH:quinone reductase [Blyttiomyces sp. JEL0837]|nr:NADPH:quinone reductase [Blyttiomyces sp. JEL0837]